MTFQSEEPRPRRRDRTPDDYEEETPDIRSSITRELVKSFRDQIHALGAFWIFIGVLAMVIGTLAIMGNKLFADNLGSQMILLFITAALGVLWLVTGIMTLLKQMWAVYVGLVLSYLSLVGQFFTLNFCGILILALVIIQAHRVIGWANKMNANHVPLTTKPD
jgi:hypothetical protein